MPRPGIRFAAALAAVPFVLAIVAHAVPTRVTPLVAAPTRPPLAFNQYLVDLRQVPPRPVIRAHFDFTNTSDRPVTISELVPSCGCLSPQLFGDQKVFKPGQAGRFYITMQTANEEPGPHEYTVKVKYQDSEPREETVAFRLVLPEVKVSVEPAELAFYQLNGDDSEATVRVSDRRARPLEVISAACTLPGVTVEVLKPEPGDDGRNKVPIKVHVRGDYPAGRHRGLVRIATSDPEFKELRVAVYVEGAGVVQAGAEVASPATK